MLDLLVSHQLLLGQRLERKRPRLGAAGGGGRGTPRGGILSVTERPSPPTREAVGGPPGRASPLNRRGERDQPDGGERPHPERRHVLQIRQPPGQGL
eukprot:scaffold29305_cov67-Isochrysis_galbana.AAC.1